MHSPFGWHYQVAKEFGWTMHEILWKVPRLQIRLMLADRPQMIRKKVKKGTMAQLDEMF
jgi:hypothetical protein